MSTLLVAMGAVVVMAAGAEASEKVGGPEVVMTVVQQAYEQKSIETFAGLMSGDYRFHTTAANVNRFAEGFTREFELRSFQGLLSGVVHSDGSRMAPAQRVSLEFGEVRTSDDPEHADSTEHYRVLCVSGMRMEMVLSSEDSIVTNPALHARSNPKDMADQRW